MLVVSRHESERIIIGDDVTVEVVRIQGDKVRIGITAPSGTSIHREEVYDAIKRVYPPEHGGEA